MRWNVKKKRIYILFAIFIICFDLKYTFNKIHHINIPYLSNYQQFLGVFYTNKEYFEKIVEDCKLYNNFRFQYTSELNESEQFSSFYDNKIVDDINCLVKSAKMTDFIKNDDFCIIYQYAPIVKSDINIGVRYNYSDNTWSYYYKHDYEHCRHKNKIVYCIYDFLYNKLCTSNSFYE